MGREVLPPWETPSAAYYTLRGLEFWQESKGDWDVQRHLFRYAASSLSFLYDSVSVACTAQHYLCFFLLALVFGMMNQDAMSFCRV